MLKYCFSAIWLAMAVPAYTQTIPDLSDLSPDEMPAAPENDSWMDLTLPEFLTGGEADREVNGCYVTGRPAWLLSPNRDTHAAAQLVQAIGFSQWMSKVVATGECSCENRWPDWPKVIEEFREKYAGLDNQMLFKIDADYRSIMRRDATAAYAICREQGR